jgi:membrane protease YdiL (CAAX protease family)
MIQAGLAGIMLGVLYLATGRNLVAPIVAHGTTRSTAARRCWV